MPDGNVAPASIETSTPGSGKDKLVDLIAELQNKAAIISGKDPSLSKEIGSISNSVSSSKADVSDENFRTRVAYALQDVEKLAGPIAAVPPDLRDEMRRLASTAPGLENEQVKALVKSTEGITDRELVSNIREFAREVGIDRGEQNSPDTMSKLAALEDSARHKYVSPATSPAVTAGSAEAAGDPGRAPDVNRTARPPWPEKDASKEDARANAAATMADSGRSPPTVAMGGPGTATTDTPAAKAAVGPPTNGIGGLVSSIANAVAASMREAYAPTGTGPKGGMLANIAAGEAQIQNRNDEATMQRTEASGKAALEAHSAFTASAAAGVMNKINEAAKVTPGGMEGVIGGMRAGGAFADLRSEFNTALVAERGAGAALDKMVSTMQAYGADRAEVAGIASKSAKAGAINSRFEGLDAEIAVAATSTPSKSEGRAVLEDLAEKMKEMLEKAITSLRSKVSPSGEKPAVSSSGPSPGG